MGGRHLRFPFTIGEDGRPEAPKDLSEHVRGEVIQLLLTDPGERLFRPTFGGGLKRLVFEANDDLTASLAKARITKALNLWLSERLEVIQVEAAADEGVLTVDVVYRLKATGETKCLQFQHVADEGGA